MAINTIKRMRYILPIILSLCVAFGVAAKKNKPRPEYPRAEVKVSYDYYHKFVRGSDGVVEKTTPFVLLANRTQSKFYCPSTEFKDSLMSTPSGRAKEKEMFKAAAEAYIDKRDLSAMDAVVYHSRLYVTKDFDKATSTTYDQAGMGEHGWYEEPFTELTWVIVEDSLKTILSYQCIMATADYHGRTWTVWFAPEIPVYDGPWKFTGLPGLILEATEPSGQHSFTATGLESTTQPIKPIYSSDYSKMDRIDMLRALRHYRQNGNSMVKAAIGLDLGQDTPQTEENKIYDFLETDYH